MDDEDAEEYDDAADDGHGSDLLAKKNGGSDEGDKRFDVKKRGNAGDRDAFEQVVGGVVERDELLLDDPAHAVAGAEDAIDVAALAEFLHDADERLVDDGSGSAGLSDDCVAFCVRGHDWLAEEYRVMDRTVQKGRMIGRTQFASRSGTRELNPIGPIIFGGIADGFPMNGLSCRRCRVTCISFRVRTTGGTR